MTGYADPLHPWSSDIILIGPVTAGKSTVAPLLAERLQIPHIALDRIAAAYYEESGCGEDVFEKIRQEQGFLAAYRRWWPSLAYATERLLTDYHHCVIDLGAGHSHYEDPELFARVRRALAPYRSVVLLLPSPDLDASVHILRGQAREQQGWDWVPDGYDFIEHWVKDHCNHDLATMIVYTQGRTPAETCDDILLCVQHPGDRNTEKGCNSVKIA